MNRRPFNLKFILIKTKESSIEKDSLRSVRSTEDRQSLGSTSPLNMTPESTKHKDTSKSIDLHYSFASTSTAAKHDKLDSDVDNLDDKDAIVPSKSSVTLEMGDIISGLEGSPYESLHNIWYNFPRTSSFYFPILSSIENISKGSMTKFLSLMIGWIPQRMLASSDLISPALLEELEQTSSDNKISFTEFASKIPNFKLSDQIALDLVEFSALQVVGDILSTVLSEESQYLEPDNYEKIAQLSISFLSHNNPRAIDPIFWSSLMKPVRAQWSVVLGYVAPYIMKYLTQFVSTHLINLPQQTQINILQGFSIPLHRCKEDDAISFIEAYFPQFLKDKSTPMRVAQIEAMTNWIQSLDLKSSDKLFEAVKQVYKVITKMLTRNEELELPGQKLI